MTESTPSPLPLHIHVQGAHILYDSSLIEPPSRQFFDPAYWRGQDALHGEALGRGTTYLFHCTGHDLVLRHYRRGGLMAKLSNDRYHWSGLEQTRAWREWFLLAEMYQQGLPVPRPVAARVVRCGLFYTADLVTQRLPQVTPLADMLMARELSEQQWREIGATIRRFHQGGFYHADLNARNILVDDAGRVFVIDFDKGENRALEQSWQHENLERLQRSLLKFKKSEPRFWFDEQCWQWLLVGYVGAASAAM